MPPDCSGVGRSPLTLGQRMRYRDPPAIVLRVSMSPK
jgi:hypothetical protein